MSFITERMGEEVSTYLNEIPDWYKALSSSFYDLLREENFVDLTFICLKDGGRVSVHKPLLINCRYLYE